jgi:hypothetical protein
VGLTRIGCKNASVAGDIVIKLRSIRVVRKSDGVVVVAAGKVELEGIGSIGLAID